MNSPPNRASELSKNDKGAFLKSLIKLIKADFATGLIPEYSVEIGMHAVHQHGQDQLAVNFAF